MSHSLVVKTWKTFAEKCLLQVWEAVDYINALWTEQRSKGENRDCNKKKQKSFGDVSYHPSKEIEKGTERPHESLIRSFMTCQVDKNYHLKKRSKFCEVVLSRYVLLKNYI